MLYKNFIIICLSFLTVIPKNEEVISWHDTTKLSWSQFKGAPKPSLSAVAVTASGITFEFSVKETETRVVSFDTKVFAHFYPYKSWYIKEQSDKHILAHEQLHFDITELYARKFRKDIAQLKINNSIKLELRALHERINKELATTQNRYDTESDNSLNRVFQVKWNRYVEQELAKLEAFKSKD